MDIEQALSARTLTDSPTFSFAPCSHAAAQSAPALLIEHARCSVGRAQVEEFIRREFFEHFGACIKGYMPRLLALHEPDGEVRAAVGMRGAGDGRLFLERYTRAPVELVIAERVGYTVPREQIVEVGSLACRGGRAAMDIVKAVIPALIGAGFTWVVFTGADTVLNVFRRLKLAPHALCTADKHLLGDEQHDWGTYYDHNPVVMAGRLVDGIHTLDATPGVQ